ncbi:hypothetical protein Tco_1341107, partial [Tanacetum coccineum]
KQTSIPLPIRSPRNVSSSDKTISEELTADVSPTTATTSKILSKLKLKKKSFTHKARKLPGSIAGMSRQRGLIRYHIKKKFITKEFFLEKIKEVLEHCNTIVLELITKMNEIIKKEMPHLVKLVVD